MPKTELKTKGDAKKSIADLKKKFRDDIKIMVGLPRDATPYPDGTSVAMVGAVHEFGNDQVPERSFLRSTISEERENIKKDMTKVITDVANGKLDIDLGAGLVGKKYSDKVQKKIIDISDPPNSKETIRRKGSSNPLVDTGHLNRSITYEVRKSKDA